MDHAVCDELPPPQRNLGAAEVSGQDHRSVARVFRVQSGFSRNSSTYRLFRRPVARTSMGLSVISLTEEMPASGRKKTKWLGKSG